MQTSIFLATQCTRWDGTAMGTALTSHQSTSSIQDTITCVQSSQYRYPTLLGSIAYTKVLLQGTSQKKVNILNVPAHGKGRHSMEAFSVVGPTMWNVLLTNELRECTSVDGFKKRLNPHLFHLHY